MNITEFLSSPQVMDAYRKWINDPMTKVVQELLLQEGQPRRLPFEAIRGEVALELHGESVGWFACCDRMITMDQEIAAETQEPVSQFKEPERQSKTNPQE